MMMPFNFPLTCYSYQNRSQRMHSLIPVRPMVFFSEQYLARLNEQEREEALERARSNHCEIYILKGQNVQQNDDEDEVTEITVPVFARELRIENGVSEADTLKSKYPLFRPSGYLHIEANEPNFNDRLNTYLDKHHRCRKNHALKLAGLGCTLLGIAAFLAVPAVATLPVTAPVLLPVMLALTVLAASLLISAAICFGVAWHRDKQVRRDFPLSPAPAN